MTVSVLCSNWTTVTRVFELCATRRCDKGRTRSEAPEEVLVQFVWRGAFGGHGVESSILGSRDGKIGAVVRNMFALKNLATNTPISSLDAFWDSTSEGMVTEICPGRESQQVNRDVEIQPPQCPEPAGLIPGGATTKRRAFVRIFTTRRVQQTKNSDRR